MGQTEDLECKCGGVRVKVHQNYITTETKTDAYEIGEIEEVVSSYVPLVFNPVDIPLNEDKLWRVSALLREAVERVGELEWELKRLVKLVDDIR
jgi:hypothetical protein|tara:strand:- start:579 stop:860 length:282 start_codon:yes stop_codon:yes gene_type:complete